MAGALEGDIFIGPKAEVTALYTYSRLKQMISIITI